MLRFGGSSWLGRTALALAFVLSFLLGVGAVMAYGQRDRIEGRFFPDRETPGKPAETFEWSTLETGLLTLKRADIPLGNTAGFTTGGAIAATGNTIIYVSASGHIATLDIARGLIEYSAQRVPMNFDHLQKNVFPRQSTFNAEWYRVQDILLVPSADGTAGSLYVSHNTFDEGKQEVCAQVSEIGLQKSGDSIRISDGPWREVYRLRECLSMERFGWVFFGLEGGGSLLQLDEEHILFAVGDYGTAWETAIRNEFGADAPNDFSKILRINRHSGEAVVFANGVRNPQGMTRDSDGNIWQAEHGPQGGDEINLVHQEADFGWPTVSLGTDYGTPREPITTNPVQGRHEGYRQPVMAFMPSIGLSGIQALPENPNAFALWSGDLLAASLKSHSLYRLRREGQQFIYAEPVPLAQRVRDIALLENGWIAILGRQDRTIILLRDVADNVPDTVPPLEIKGYEAVAAREAEVVSTLGSPVWGRIIFTQKCSRCHSVNDELRLGPPLNGVVDRPVGTVDGFEYSDSLALASGRWTSSRLQSYMAAPETMFPGTTMPGGYNLKRWERRQVVAYLKSLDQADAR